MKNVYFYDTCIGKIGIASENDNITNLFFENEKINEKMIINEISVLKKASLQLKKYLSGKQKHFELPLMPKGTSFMQTVWDELKIIPYGETRTYKEIANAIDKPKAYRAVGSANNKNPIPIFIPCHRVIGSNGKLVGYRQGLDLKEKLLQLETKYKKSNI